MPGVCPQKKNTVFFFVFPLSWLRVTQARRSAQEEDSLEMRTRLIVSAQDPRGFPTSGLPEVAFLGRSNVGKSSLLNAIAAARIARTSHTPGRTQQVNFFELHGPFGEVYLVDLPGYGFAKGPKELQERLAPLVLAYVEGRGTVALAFLLIDLRRGVEQRDAEVFNLLAQGPGRRLVKVIATKSDKLNKASVKPATHAIAQQLGIPSDHVIATSVVTRAGLDALLASVQAVAHRQPHD